MYINTHNTIFCLTLKNNVALHSIVRYYPNTTPVYELWIWNFTFRLSPVIAYSSNFGIIMSHNDDGTQCHILWHTDTCKKKKTSPKRNEEQCFIFWGGYSNIHNFQHCELQWINAALEILSNSIAGTFTQFMGFCLNQILTQTHTTTTIASILNNENGRHYKWGWLISSYLLWSFVAVLPSMLFVSPQHPCPHRMALVCLVLWPFKWFVIVYFT